MNRNDGQKAYSTSKNISRTKDVTKSPIRTKFNQLYGSVVEGSREALHNKNTNTNLP